MASDNHHQNRRLTTTRIARRNLQGISSQVKPTKPNSCPRYSLQLTSFNNSLISKRKTHPRHLTMYTLVHRHRHRHRHHHCRRCKPRLQVSISKQGTAKNSRSTTTNNEQPTNKQRTMNGDQRNGQTTTKEQRTTTNNDEGRRTKDDEGRRTTKDEGRRTTNDELKFCVVIHSSFVVRSFVRSFVCSKERH